MKTIRKIFVLLTVLAMVLSLTACGSLSAAKTARNTLKAESCHADCRVEMGLNLGMLGRNVMDLDLIAEVSADLNREPLRGAGDFQMEMMDETVNGRYYFIQEGEELLFYSTADGEIWSVNTIDLPGGSEGAGFDLSVESLAAFASLTKGFEESGTETVNGSEATVYSGTVSGEDLQAMTEASGAALPAELDPGTLGVIPVTVAVDQKTDMVSRITVDLSEMTDRLLPVFLQLGLQAAAENDEGGGTDKILSLISRMDIHCDQLLITVQLSDYNEVGEITIPDEVIAAAKAA